MAGRLIAIRTQQVIVHDIAGEEDKYDLDSHGFQICNHSSVEKDFVDDEAIKVSTHRSMSKLYSIRDECTRQCSFSLQAQYYPETEQLLKDV